jgi:serine/threonine-protein kinase
VISEPLRTGDVFAGYRVEDEAGRGGMGTVLRAVDVELERTVALKLVDPALASDQAFSERFRREWRLLAALDHPHVIPIYGAGEHDGRLYLVMRWVRGGDLAQRLAGTTGLDPALAVDIISQVASALDAAHERGVIHRDVKPGNVLLEDGHAWLSDFGAGKDLARADTATVPGRWIGTVDYVAPELLDGAPADARADIYSLACVLFEALTGRPPFRRETEVATLWAHRHDPPPSTSELRAILPKGVDKVLARALSKDPAKRPASAGELARATRAALAAPPPGAETKVGVVAPPAPPSRRLRAGLLGAGLALGLAVGAVAAIVLGGGGDRQPASATVPPPPRFVRVERISLGAHSTAGDLIALPQFTYVLDPQQRELDAIKSSSRQVVRRRRLPGVPTTLAASSDNNDLWVGMDNHRVMHIDLVTGKRVVVKTDIEPDYLAVLDNVVMVLANPDSGGRLERIDISANKVLGKVKKIGGAPSDMVADGGYAYILFALPPTIVAFDEKLTQKSLWRVKSGGVPPEMTKAVSDFWISVYDEGTVVRVNDFDGKTVGKPVPVGHKPNGIDYDYDTNSIWVADTGDETVTRVDAKAARVTARISTKGPLAGPLSLSGGVVWASGTHDVVRIEPVGSS